MSSRESGFRREQLLRSIMVFGLAAGTTTHFLMLLRLMPVPSAPAGYHWFWTALTVVDPLIAASIIFAPRVGLVATVVTIALAPFRLTIPRAARAKKASLTLQYETFQHRSEVTQRRLGSAAQAAFLICAGACSRVPEPPSETSVPARRRPHAQSLAPCKPVPRITSSGCTIRTTLRHSTWGRTRLAAWRMRAPTATARADA